MEATVSQNTIQAAVAHRALPRNLRGTSFAEQAAPRLLKISYFLRSTVAGCRKQCFFGSGKILAVAAWRTKMAYAFEIAPGG
ncbi:MAG: hypothetical protein JNN31_08380 [Dechloromonas sp.]|nr:hypothetical protein [Dechloromonas sp.]